MNQVGRYQILEEIGRGACGVVYRALDPAIGRTVAIKSIRFSDVSDPAERRNLREGVLREAQSAGKLSHPNIVTIYDVLESEDLAYIFMEFVDGPSLKDALRREALPEREAMLSILRQIADALDYAHRKGIIHRDIKPANIMISERGVDKDGVAKIADFGVAKLISHETTQQRLVGTPSYMSPEQIEGVGVDGKSDQFALGVVVYELLTGDKPFHADNLAALHYMICKRAAAPVQELNPALNETVNRVMERVLAKEPENRYAACGAFLGALQMALAECPEWKPMAPRKSEEVVKAADRRGWYAPETVVSAPRLAAADSDGGNAPILVIDADVLPAEETALSTRVASAEERAEFADGQVRRLEPRIVRGETKIRVGIEPPAARTWGLTMAAFAVVILLGIGLLHSLSSNRPGSGDGPSGRVVTAPPPEDLNTGSEPQVNVTPPAAPTAVGNDTSSSRTTVSVPTPATAATVPVAIKKDMSIPVATPKAVVKASLPPPRPVPLPAPAAPTGTSEVELVSDPPGARIEVDRRADLSCLAPCTVTLGPGRHTLAADLTKYGTVRKVFTVPVEGKLFIPMMRNMGTLFLDSVPTGASVAIDGRDYGATPVEVKLSAGRHHLALSDGVRHHEETIQVDTDGMIPLKIKW